MHTLSDWGRIQPKRYRSEQEGEPGATGTRSRDVRKPGGRTGRRINSAKDKVIYTQEAQPMRRNCDGCRSNC